MNRATKTALRTIAQETAAAIPLAVWERITAKAIDDGQQPDAIVIDALDAYLKQPRRARRA